MLNISGHQWDSNQNDITLVPTKMAIIKQSDNNVLARMW